MEWPKNQLTNGRTYRDAWTHLKIYLLVKILFWKWTAMSFFIFSNILIGFYREKGLLSMIIVVKIFSRPLKRTHWIMQKKLCAKNALFWTIGLDSSILLRWFYVAKLNTWLPCGVPMLNHRHGIGCSQSKMRLCGSWLAVIRWRRGNISTMKLNHPSYEVVTRPRGPHNMKATDQRTKHFATKNLLKKMIRKKSIQVLLF